MDWTLAGSVIFTGLTVVFAVLVILMVAVLVMGKLVTLASGKKADAPVQAAPAARQLLQRRLPLFLTKRWLLSPPPLPQPSATTILRFMRSNVSKGGEGK